MNTDNKRIQKGTRQLLRHDKSQRTNHVEKHLHEFEKSGQQNFRGQTVKGSNPSKCCIRGKLPSKGEKTVDADRRLTR